MKLVAALLLAAAALAIAPAAGAQTPIPPRPDSWVLDQAGVLSAAAVSNIHAELEAYNRQTGNQIAVLLVRSLGDQSIENYATDVFSAWGVGEKGKDNGVLIVLAMDDRRGRIEVGYGLEGTLTDLQAKEVLDMHIFPRLRNGDPDGAVISGQRALRAQLGDTTAPAPIMPFPSTSPSEEPSPWLTTGAFVLIFILISLVGNLGRGRRRRHGWGSGGFYYGGSSGWGGSGFGGGFGGSGGGFGGFGGGSSGGGGASGSW